MRIHRNGLDATIDVLCKTINNPLIRYVAPKTTYLRLSHKKGDSASRYVLPASDIHLHPFVMTRHIIQLRMYNNKSRAKRISYSSKNLFW